MRSATSMALRTRQKAGIGLTEPVNPFDLCSTLNVEVRFADIASMEGMLARNPRLTVIVSSARPPGRQAFTCAHELGHLVLDHASTVDQACELTESGLALSQADHEEVAADQFAAFLLMPKTAVTAALRDRGLDPTTCDPADLFALASVFGVGWITLIAHLRMGLRLISHDRYVALRRIRPSKLRAQLLGQDCSGLVVVNSHWRRPFIDTVVGDSVWFPDGRVATQLPTESPEPGGILVTPDEPGTHQLETQHATPLAIRTMPAGYAGRSLYRYLPPADDDGHDP